MPNDPTGTYVPLWVALVGALALVVSTLGPVWLSKRNARIAAANTPPVPVPLARGVNGKSLSRLMETVDQLVTDLGTVSSELETAKGEIDTLKTHDKQKQQAIAWAIDWGVNAAGDPPRPVPDYLKAFLQNNGGS